jgi:sigma-B regulation protein RsbU (phosphoserine phosphatase)
MATFSSPFFKESGHTSGVVTADLALAWLRTLVGSVKIYDSGYAFLLSKNGAFITAPRTGRTEAEALLHLHSGNPEKLIMRESIFSVAEARNDKLLRQIGLQMVRGHEGLARVEDFVSNRMSLLYYAPLHSNGWSLGVVFPETEVYADIRSLNVRLLCIGLIGILLLTGVVVIISNSVARPLTVLAARSADIAQGNLEIELPSVNTKDEVGDLAHSFQEMRLALKDYIADLAQATAARQKIESELKIASTIQASFLPKRFPPFPQKDAVDIFADLLPAKMVGGDLYDFFAVDEHRLFVAIGDVSGKGVPAALFMAVTKTLLKGSAQLNLDPASVLTRVNLELCLDNDSAMFTTTICALLDLTNGELTFANAGHNPALLLRRGGGVEWLAHGESAPLGCFEETCYKNHTMRLFAGDILLLYTDGVTEAVNAKDEFFSEDRLCDVFQGCQGLSAQKAVAELLQSVQKFSEGTEQFDDVTLLALKYHGFSGRERG